MQQEKAKVHVIQAGYAKWQDNNKAQKADGSITLVQSSKNCIVDTGLPKDKQMILNALKTHNLSTHDIDYVICTHGDADHVSNNNLFPGARLIVGFDIFDRDRVSFFTKDHAVDSNVTISAMTGHDDRSVGVVVKTDTGVVVITGDLFERENDWHHSADWIAFSKRPKEQIENRAKVWQLADFIVPGHGPMFKVDKSIDIFDLESKQLQAYTQNVYLDIET